MKAERPISRLVIAALALACIGVASIIVLLLRSAPDVVVVGTVRSIGSHRLCVSAATEHRCAESDSPRSIEGFVAGDCVRLTTSSNGTLIKVQHVPACP